MKQMFIAIMLLVACVVGCGTEENAVVSDDDNIDALGGGTTYCCAGSCLDFWVADSLYMEEHSGNCPPFHGYGWTLERTGEGSFNGCWNNNHTHKTTWVAKYMGYNTAYPYVIREIGANIACGPMCPTVENWTVTSAQCNYP